jgi:predicted Rossmann fold flavoprotein
MTPTEVEKPVVVVGAGAAGLLAALTAARAGADVVLLERTRDGGRKILISGGGRCNILPSVAQPERYVTDSSPNTLRKMLRSWPLREQRAFFETELGMPLEREEETGKLFPSSHRAKDVRDGLVERVREAGARMWFEATVSGVTPNVDGGWTVGLEDAPALEARAVIIATGGLSVPKTGSDGTGLSVAETLGHRMHATYPALTPLTADPHPHAKLAGISGTVTITAPGSRPSFSTTDGFLITHDGWSGPSVLDASHLAIRGRSDGSRQEVIVQWSDRTKDDWEKIFAAPRGTVRNVVTPHVARRLADHLLTEAGVDPATPLSQLKKTDRRKKAEVTGGGVALDQVNPRTLESRVCPGLYFCGEVLDAFGPIGGHNFLWAWATGRSAGAAAAR